MKVHCDPTPTLQVCIHPLGRHASTPPVPLQDSAGKCYLPQTQRSRKNFWGPLDLGCDVKDEWDLLDFTKKEEGYDSSRDRIYRNKEMYQSVTLCWGQVALLGWAKGCEEESQERGREVGSDSRIRKGFCETKGLMRQYKLPPVGSGEPPKNFKQEVDMVRSVISKF